MSGQHRAPLFTVAICTYDRATLLRRMLGTLAIQSGVDRSDIEVLVVDNNCSDETPGVCAEAAESLPLRHVVERRQGLSNARNRAVAEAKGSWILFTDDDVRLGHDWLRTFIGGPARFSDALFFGGRIVPDWGPEGKPRWFKGERLDGLAGTLGWYELPGQSRMLDGHDPLPFGASFAFHRDVAALVGRFDPTLGVSAAAIGRGEEIDFLRRARAKGFRGAYLAEAVCQHPVDRSRLTLRGLYRRGRASGYAHRAIQDPTARGSWWRAALFVVRGFYQLCKGRGDRFRQCVINAGIQAALAGRKKA